MIGLENDLWKSILDRIGICEPDIGFSLNDVLKPEDDKSCGCCDNYEICKMIVRDKLF